MKKFYNQFIQDMGRIVTFIFMLIFTTLDIIMVQEYWWLFLLVFIAIVGLVFYETYKDMKNYERNINNI